MYKHPDCFFCKEIDDPLQNVLGKNRIVYETENFVLFPTLGCFIVGYLLVMPKQHFLCFGELSPVLLDELDNIIFRLSEYVQRKENKKCIVFEHGTRDLNKLTPTSIMHAHIHVIPFEKNIISYLPRESKVKKIEGFTDLEKETDNYLFLKNIDENNYIVENHNYPSQFFRRIVCDAVGMSGYWDWREHAFLENMKKTIDYYGEL